MTGVLLGASERPLASVSGNPAVLHHVGHDQRQREEEDAEDEVAEPAVPFSARNPGRPERNQNPDDQPDDPTDPPHTRLLLVESSSYVRTAPINGLSVAADFRLFRGYVEFMAVGP